MRGDGSGIGVQGPRRAGLGLLLLLLLFFVPGRSGAEGEATELRVMSFNIRFANPLDGKNAWSKRRDLVVSTIRDFGPDLLGTQEVTRGQSLFLKKKLPGYGFVGAGRRDGRQSGEMTAIFYRKKRFRLLGQGHFWLSPTPNRPGSKGWDAAHPRITSWARLRDRATGRTLVHFNTHFDHEGETARRESARLLRRMIDRAGKQGDIVVTGDFNTTEDGKPYAILCDGDARPALRDAYRVVHPERNLDEMTFHDFKGNRLGLRIDWILFAGALKPTRATIDHTHKEDRYPSDHFPVTAVFKTK